MIKINENKFFVMIFDDFFTKFTHLGNLFFLIKKKILKNFLKKNFKKKIPKIFFFQIFFQKIT